MTAVAPIKIWSGCDPQLEQALAALCIAWGPYSAQSRGYPIFKLLRDFIDPAWSSLCHRHPALSHDVLMLAWMRFRLKMMIRTKQREESGLAGTSPLSSIAHKLGFDALDQFVQEVARAVMTKYSGCEFDQLQPSLDTLREMAVRCRGKKPKRRALGKFGKVDLLDDMKTCRACERPTELAAHVATVGDACPAGEARRLSSTYCSTHSPEKTGSTTARANYKRARRSQQTFETELNRLERQYWGRPATSRDKSTDPSVDEFFRQLSIRRGLTVDSEVARNAHPDLELLLRREARKLVDRRMSDRKKEMVVLLSAGMSQPQVAEKLGLKSRQAVSKALQSIPADYRFDAPLVSEASAIA